MATVQERIKALGLTKASKAGGRRNIKKKTKTSLEQKLSAMIQEGKPVPKHLAKKAEEILNNLKMEAQPLKTVPETTDLPSFEEQDDNIPEINFDPDSDNIPNLVDMPYTIEETNEENIVVL